MKKILILLFVSSPFFYASACNAKSIRTAENEPDQKKIIKFYHGSDTCTEEVVFSENKELGLLSKCVNTNGRKYNLYVPKNHLNGSPLLVALHGAGPKLAGNFVDSAEKHLEYTDIPAILSHFNLDMIALFPEGTEHSDGLHWNDGRKIGNSSEEVFPGKDQEFIEDLILTTQKHYGARQTYLWGMSNGGIMALKLTCNSQIDFAGTAVVSASMYQTLTTDCPNAGLTKILFIYGRKDSVMGGSSLNDPGRGGPIVSMSETTSVFCRNGMTKTSTINSKPLPKDDFVDKKVGCDGRVAWLDVNDGGHRWFDGKNAIFGNTKEIHSSIEALSFWNLIHKTDWMPK